MVHLRTAVLITFDKLTYTQVRTAVLNSGERARATAQRMNLAEESVTVTRRVTSEFEGRLRHPGCLGRAANLCSSQVYER